MQRHGYVGSRGKRNIIYPQQPTLAFRRFFQHLTPAAQDALWSVYCAWNKRNATEDFARFKQYYEKSRDEARYRIEAWESPFINGKKGEEYQISFDVPECAVRFDFKGLKEAGLEMSIVPGRPNSRIIRGVPPAAGEYDISLLYIWRGWVSKYPLLKRVFKLLINPDPRDLWEDIPSDQSGEYARPDVDFATLFLPPVEMWAASRRGRSHAHTGKARDDAFALGTQDDWYIMAVADGAGSAEFSRKGAEIACATALAASKDKLANDAGLEKILMEVSAGTDPVLWQPQAKKIAYSILPNAAFEAHKSIRQEAESKEREPRAYATTLLLAMTKKFPGGWSVMSFQVGDGAMAMFADGRVELLAQPDEGEYGGQTRFITMPEIFESNELMRRLRIDFVANLEGLALMTDGISDARFVTLDGLKDESLWRELWQEVLPLASGPEPRESLLDWLNFWSRGNHDDRTLALLAVEP